MATALYARMLASVADRDRAIKVLQESFAEGRLSWGEFDDRVGRALASRDFPELSALTDDLPVGPLGRMPAHRATPRPGARSVEAGCLDGDRARRAFRARKAAVLGAATGISWGFVAAVIKELSSHLGDAGLSMVPPATRAQARRETW